MIRRSAGTTSPRLEQHDVARARAPTAGTIDDGAVAAHARDRGAMPSRSASSARSPRYSVTTSAPTIGRSPSEHEQAVAHLADEDREAARDREEQDERLRERAPSSIRQSGLALDASSAFGPAAMARCAASAALKPTAVSTFRALATVAEFEGMGLARDGHGAGIASYRTAPTAIALIDDAGAASRIARAMSSGPRLDLGPVPEVPWGTNAPGDDSLNEREFCIVDCRWVECSREYAMVSRSDRRNEHQHHQIASSRGRASSVCAISDAHSVTASHGRKSPSGAFTTAKIARSANPRVFRSALPAKTRCSIACVASPSRPRPSRGHPALADRPAGRSRRARPVWSSTRSTLGRSGGALAGAIGRHRQHSR